MTQPLTTALAAQAAKTSPRNLRYLLDAHPEELPSHFIHPRLRVIELTLEEFLRRYHAIPKPGYHERTAEQRQVLVERAAMMRQRKREKKVL